MMSKSSQSSVIIAKKLIKRPAVRQNLVLMKTSLEIDISFNQQSSLAILNMPSTCWGIGNTIAHLPRFLNLQSPATLTKSYLPLEGMAHAPTWTEVSALMTLDLAQSHGSHLVPPTLSLPWKDQLLLSVLLLTMLILKSSKIWQPTSFLSC